MAPKAPFIHPDWYPMLDRLSGGAQLLPDLLDRVNSMEATVMEALNKLIAEVAEYKTVVSSAVALIEGFKTRLNEAGTDPVLLEQLATEMDATTQSLAAAVAANTVADPVSPEPLPDPAPPDSGQSTG